MIWSLVEESVPGFTKRSDVGDKLLQGMVVWRVHALEPQVCVARTTLDTLKLAVSMISGRYCFSQQETIPFFQKRPSPSIPCSARCPDPKAPQSFRVGR